MRGTESDDESESEKERRALPSHEKPSNTKARSQPAVKRLEPYPANPQNHPTAPIRLKSLNPSIETLRALSPTSLKTIPAGRIRTEVSGNSSSTSAAGGGLGFRILKGPFKGSGWDALKNL